MTTEFILTDRDGKPEDIGLKVTYRTSYPRPPSTKPSDVVLFPEDDFDVLIEDAETEECSALPTVYDAPELLPEHREHLWGHISDPSLVEDVFALRPRT